MLRVICYPYRREGRGLLIDYVQFLSRRSILVNDVMCLVTTHIGGREGGRSRLHGYGYEYRIWYGYTKLKKWLIRGLIERVRSNSTFSSDVWASSSSLFLSLVRDCIEGVCLLSKMQIKHERACLMNDFFLSIVIALFFPSLWGFPNGSSFHVGTS